MSNRPDKNMLGMDGWPGGVNNRIRETEQSAQRGGETIPSSQFLRKALNVDLTAEGHPLRRRGYTLLEAGYSHSAFYANGLFFVVVDGNLKVGPKSSELTTITTVNKYLRLSYAVHADDVYFSNGQDSGKYTSNGLEVWPAVQQEYKIHDDEDLELTDNFYETMPIGHLIASHSGRIWTAKQSTLWFSEAMSPNMARLATNYFMLPSYIRMIQPVTSGMFVGTENEVMFLRGGDPFESTLEHVYNHGIVSFAFTRLPGEKFNAGRDHVPVFWTLDGVMHVGLPDGTIQPLTRDRLAVPEFGSGAVSLREREGISQVVSALQKGGDANNMGATDSVVAEIRRS